jgi:hypothetical protein
MNHPITPPPELVEQWRTDYISRGHAFLDVAKEIAQWGSDQELEACCEWVDWKWSGIKSRELRAARRPKPPSLKEEALKALERMQDQYPHLKNKETIRQALEALPE